MAERKEAGMVERVARAIALQDCCDPDFVDTKGRVQWTYHVELARAAIAAMGEPTKAMVEASLPEAWIGHPEASEASIERYWAGHRTAGAKKWRAMISAALAEETSDA